MDTAESTICPCIKGQIPPFAISLMEMKAVQLREISQEYLESKKVDFIKRERKGVSGKNKEV